jgi:putative hydrolase of the HAD superfamily
MNVRAVGFDLDETLVAVDRPRAELLAAATDRVNGPPLSREAYLEAHAEHSGARSREPVFAALLDGQETETDPAALAAAYREAVAEAMSPVTDVPALIGGLRDRYRVGLLTDGPDGTQRDKLSRLGWTDLFDAAVVTGTLDAPKPAPGAFAALAEALDVSRERTAYVGDHPENDVAGASEAGLTPVQVLYETGPPAHPAAAATVRRSELRNALPEVLTAL